MTEHPLTRTEMLIGTAALEQLKSSKVAIFGIGGVGGYTAEALARSGIGTLMLIDNDTVNITNLNRQIYALHSTIGQYKVDVAEKRIKDINPNCQIITKKLFYLPENANEIDLTAYDYVIDCIDTIKGKLELARRCYQQNIPIISSMGAANKMQPTGFKVTDISKTQIDPIAKIMRKKLRKDGVKHLKVVYSDELPHNHYSEIDYNKPDNTHRPTPASNAFVPATVGLIIAGEVVNDLIKTFVL